MRTNLPLDADRLWADVMALAEITDPARPYTRRSFTPLFLEGRAWLAQRQGRWPAAAAEIDAARATFVFPAGEPTEGANGTPGLEARARTGDHTPHLLVRFSRSGWVGPAPAKIEAWLRQIESGLRDPPTVPAVKAGGEGVVPPSSDGPVTSRRA